MRGECAVVLACVLGLGGGCAYSSGGGGGGDDDVADAAPGAVDAFIWADARGSGDAGASADGPSLEGRNGYPGDFPELVDQGGFGDGEVVIGFGGDDTTDRAGNRARIARRPVILIHGNGTHANDDTFGMLHLRDMLLAAGYRPAEIWAPSYLGQDVSLAETPTPVRTNIDDVRGFIAAVMDYLDVDRVDVVGHSLGCALIHGYVRGLQSDGTFDDNARRAGDVGTVVCLGGAVYGTGYGFLYAPEFDVGGAFTTAITSWGGIDDATPFGAADVTDMIAPATGTLPGLKPFARASTADDGSRRIHWVALWAIGDIVDGNLPGACGLQGADLNRGFTLPDSLPGVLTAQLARHGHLLRSQDVFDAFAPYLDR